MMGGVFFGGMVMMMKRAVGAFIIIALMLVLLLPGVVLSNPGPGDITGPIDDITFETSEGMYAVPTRISNTVVCFAYVGNTSQDLYLKTYSLDGSGNFGSQIDSLTVVGTFGGDIPPDLCHMQGDVYVVGLIDWNLGAVQRAVIGSIDIDSSGNIGAAWLDTLDYVGVDGRAGVPVRVSDTIAMIGWADLPLNNYYIYTVEVDGSGNFTSPAMDSQLIQGPPAGSQILLNPYLVPFRRGSSDVYCVGYGIGDTPYSAGCGVYIKSITINSVTGIISAVVDTMYIDSSVYSVEYATPYSASFSGRVDWCGLSFFTSAVAAPPFFQRLATFTCDSSGTLGAAFADEVLISSDCGPGLMATAGYPTDIFVCTYVDGVSYDVCNALTYQFDGVGDLTLIDSVVPYTHLAVAASPWPEQVQSGTGDCYWVIAYCDVSLSDIFADSFQIGSGLINDSTIPTVTTNAASNVLTTTARLNGYLDDDGSGDYTENCYYAFEYDIDGGTPYAFSTSWSTITINSSTAFYVDVASLQPGTTYYFRAKCYNSVGTGYGSEMSFTTAAVDPSITTNAATNVSITTAQLNSYIDDDGGDGNCYVRFEYDDDQVGSYDFATSWVSGYDSGDSPWVSVDNLSPNTQYWFRVQIYNETLVIISGSELTFTTLTLVGDVTGFYAIPTAENSIELYWDKASGSNFTRIQRKTGGYPISVTDGVSIYFGNEASIEDVYAVVAGVAYYYSAWGFAPDDYWSVGSEDLMITAIPSDPALVDPDSPGEGGWFSIGDPTNLSDLPFYESINACADSFGIPRGAFWVLLACIVATALGLFTFIITKSAVAALIAIATIFVMCNIAIGLPLWMLMVVGVLGVGVVVAWARV